MARLLAALLLATTLIAGGAAYSFRGDADEARSQLDAAVQANQADQEIIAQMQRAIGDLMISTSSTDPSRISAAFAKAYCAQDVEAMWAALDPETQASFVRIYGDGKAGLAGEAQLSNCISAHFGGSYVGPKGIRSIYIYSFATPDGAESTYFIITSSEAGVLGLE